MRAIFTGLLLIAFLSGCAKITDFKVGEAVIVKTNQKTEVTGTIKSFSGEWVVVEASDKDGIHQTWLKIAGIKSVKQAPGK